jgi:hypothetical protein
MSAKMTHTAKPREDARHAPEELDKLPKGYMSARSKPSGKKAAG